MPEEQIIGNDSFDVLQIFSGTFEFQAWFAVWI